MGLVSLLLFGLSSLRHALFQSGAWDLGIFDQATYLISQGLPPISTLVGFHILGDHAAVIFYPLALLYRISPSVHWLLAVQAIGLTIALWPLWKLCRQAGLSPTQTGTIGTVYLLYPVVFNANLSDFHPEVLAIPALLEAVYAARAGLRWRFGLCLALILSCKAALALNVAALGVWLLLVERRRFFGLLALVAGLGWFGFATQVIIPTFGGEAAAIGRHMFRYRHLGNSYSDIALNFFRDPGPVLRQVFSRGTAEYLLLLVAPLLWFLSPRQMAPLIGALPTLLLNILSNNNGQRSLVDQYAVPILPFLLLVAIATLAQRGRLWPSRKWVLAWSLVAFLALGKYTFFFIYFRQLDTWPALREAVSRVPPQGGVLTDHQIAAHLSDRPMIKLVQVQGAQPDLAEFDHVLLNLRRPWLRRREPVEAWLRRMQTEPQFRQTFAKDDIYLFQRIR